jgi:hypothetical protein
MPTIENQSNPFSRRLAVFVLGLALACALHAQEGRTYTPGPFDHLELAGAAYVELAQGDRDEVFVSGNAALQDRVQLKLSNGHLQVRTEDGWKFWNNEPVRLKVQMRSIAELDISGASEVIAAKPLKLKELEIHISGQGTVRMSDITAQALRFDIAGAGTGELTGRVTAFQVRVAGKGKVQAQNLKTRMTDIEMSGIGNADVWVTDVLGVKVSGLGTVNYWGKPEVRRETAGMADVNAMGAK